MSVELVFNEISLNFPTASKHTARNLMTEFINTLRTATSKGAKRKLLTKSDFDYLFLASDYTIVNWRNDREVEIDERRFLRTLQDKNDPPLSDIPDLEIETNYLGSHSIGLEYAFLREALAVSFQSEDKWNCEYLELTITRLEQNGELLNDQSPIFHASSVIHVVKHTDWITSESRIDIQNGSDIWNQRNEFLPNLKFCDLVGKQLNNLPAGNVMLRPIMNKLWQLEEYCKNWQYGAFIPDNLPFKVTPDSQATLRQYRAERMFVCPDNQERLFSWHARLTPLDWRIYFIPEETSPSNQTGKMIIGYIGPHLRTVLYN